MGCRGDKRAISSALGQLNVSTSSDSIDLRTDMAYGMFDTRGKVGACSPTLLSQLYTCCCVASALWVTLPGWLSEPRNVCFPPV